MKKKKYVLSDYSFHENDGYDKAFDYYEEIKNRKARKTLRMW